MTEAEKKEIRKKIENGSIYREYRYQRWRQRIYKRDGYCCQFPDCKWPKGSLNAHHILMKWYYPQLIYSMKNGITLCEYHHKYTHSKDSEAFIFLYADIAKKNCEKPKISKKVFGKKKKKKVTKKKVTKKVVKKKRIKKSKRTLK